MHKRAENHPTGISTFEFQSYKRHELACVQSFEGFFSFLSHVQLNEAFVLTIMYHRTRNREGTRFEKLKKKIILSQIRIISEMAD